MNLLEKDQAFVWHPYTQAKTAAAPLPIARGKGAWLYDDQDNAYLDAVASWWVNLHGHAHPYIAQRIFEQLNRLEHVIFAGFTHQPAVELAERLLAILPDRQAKIFYSDNGSTAVEIGIKMALQYFHNQGIPRTKILALEGAFHGETFGAMSASGELSLNNAFEEHLFAVERIPVPFAGEEAAALQALEQKLSENEYAAFIFEPLIQGAGGMRMYPPKALDQLIRRCQAAGVLCIADEVMTGFGRTGKLFASHHLAEQPDILCLSKGLTGGTLPLAITTCTQDIFAAFLSQDRYKTFFHGHSYTANPVGCAAGLASLDLLLSEDCQQQIQMIEAAHAQFKKQIEAHPRLQSVRHLGTIIAFEFASQGETGYFNAIRDQLYYFFLERGVLLRPLGNVIYILPPYCINKKELEKIYALIVQALDQF
ncbi:MAG: adenosylmethionine--8-amino-7-oxononanoate transaminase [Bacteroidota bacterium]